MPLVAWRDDFALVPPLQLPQAHAGQLRDFTRTEGPFGDRRLGAVLAAFKHNVGVLCDAELDRLLDCTRLRDGVNRYTEPTPRKDFQPMKSNFLAYVIQASAALVFLLPAL